MGRAPTDHAPRATRHGRPSVPHDPSFQALFEGHPLPMWVFDASSLRFLAVNDAACRAYGYSRGEFLAMTALDIRPPEDRAAIQWWLRNDGALAGSAGIWRHRRKNGAIFNADVFFHAIAFEGREARCVCAVDVTSRMAAEERALKLAQAVEQSPAATVITDSEGHIEYVNSRFVEITGYTAQEVLGKTPAVIKSGLTSPGTYRDLWATIGSGRRWRGAMQNRKKSGELYWEDESIAPLRDRTGRTVSYIAVKEDISERRRAEAVLRESETRLRQAQRNARIGSWRFVPGEPLIWSDQMYELFKLPRDVPASYDDVMATVHPGDRVAQGRGLERAIQSGASDYRAEYRVVWPDGQVRTVFSQGQINRDAEGRLVDAVGTVQDITERREAEDKIRALHEELRAHAQRLELRVAERTAELEALNKGLAAFDYSVSHDLRAPVGRIRGFSAMLVEDFGEALGERGVDLARRIGNAAREMDELVTDLLQLSTASRGELRRIEVDVTHLANAVGSQLASAAPDRRVRFTVEPSLRARADPGLLRVVLENLIGNAWKFTSKCAEARIEVGCEASGNGPKTFFIRDNGAGFDQKLAARLFAPFQRLHPKGEYPGTGIGLATVERVVERHGGRVSTHGTPGQGATFRFSLEP